MTHHWLADRTRTFDPSGIRKVFELGAKLADPINLSIGQPDFDVPVEVKEAAIEAIREGRNGYALSQGIPPLREKLQARIDDEYGHGDRQVLVTCGTSGGLVLAMWALINPGDEVIVFDPCFVMYDALAAMVGGRVVYVDTYPDFRIDVAQVAAAITGRTKMIVLNSPANPTGVVASEAEVRGLAELAARHDVVLLSDEIYREFCYEGPCLSPARYNDRVLVLDGFSKSHGMPGWRLGFAHGPSAVIEEMIKLQQYSFVCAPQPAQWAGLVALDVEMDAQIAQYRRKRDMLYQGLAERYELVRPGGAFYAFPRVPWGTGAEFVERAIRQHGLLIIPGSVFSRRDSHFRISYAADEATIRRGIEALGQLALPRP
ncbi:MAG TPA: aminotransferase class I/II-fold pyridoxal phosphate-dependent enzyme [Planctomycetaceae bacterium]|nr:aminotransferase class I/II-fold pyridoxal phosphate-dependent enzyme [Planctomycetaceae bacterium]HIQ20370.1 aminotransferase class I/II-fold pyridoxal phosphate-dependent enzyme [Planctomycetota bacterium]